MSLIPRSEEDRLLYIKRNILNKLGYPVVNVELTDEQIDMQINKSRYTYSRENPYMQQDVLDTLTDPTVDEYSLKLKDPLDRNITGIKEVYREDDNFHLFNSMYKPYFLIGNIQSMVETFSYYDIVKKVLRIDPEWTWDERTYTIRFYRKFDRKHKVLVFYFYFPLLEDIQESDLVWIIDYATAETKEILGRVRSKIQSINSSIGNIQLDGPTLLSEAQTEKQKLEEEMRNRHSHFIEPISLWD